MLTVVTPATGTALTTVEAVKAELNLTGSETDAWIADTIDGISDQVAAWCGRVFGQETVRETFRLTKPEPSLVLARWPVVSVAEVIVDGDALSSDDFEASLSHGIVHRLTANGRHLPWPAVTVTVEYTAGWLLPGQAGRDMPRGIERAIIALVARAYHARGIDPAVRSVTYSDGSSTTLGTGGWAAGQFPPEVGMALDPYRATRID